MESLIVGSTLLPTGEVIGSAAQRGKEIVVIKTSHAGDGEYCVCSGGIIRHPYCTAQAVMRVLLFYLEDGSA